MFKFNRTRNEDEEHNLPLYNSSSSSNFGPSSRRNTPRIAVPSPSFPKKRSYISWKTVIIILLSIYTFFTLVRGPQTVYVEAPGKARLAAYGGGSPRTDLHHLVMVAGHAIWKGGPTLGVDEKEWTLLPYQAGSAPTFIKHIEKGVEVAAAHEDSLLVFSGGETRSFAGPLSEAQSYWSLAYSKSLFPDTSSLFNRTSTEEFARDSYENVLFAICRFHEYTNNYPAKITVVGYEFKRHRFEEVHRAALRYPKDRFEYIGIDPPPVEGRNLLNEELEKALKPFEIDPYGCWNPDLVDKRVGRNPFRTRHGYEATSPELAGLLRWCGNQAMKDGKEQWYSGPLPWIN